MGSFQTLVETAKKLGVNIYCYVRDRITQHNQLPSLATLIMEQSKERHLDASWVSSHTNPHSKGLH